MAFILLVAFSALFVAGCAAFFSIKGLIVLFSGSALAVGIMASSLELGKLVAASFLHTYWRGTSRLLRLYLCLAVFVLMCITSLGIFGFLTGAYKEHSTRVNTFDTKIAALTLEKSGVDQAILERTDRIKALADLRQLQEQRIQSAGNLKAPREQAYKSIAEANEEIQKKEIEVSSARQRAVELDKEISELKISLDTTTDIGSFKFLASALNTDVDTAVRYFIFALIFVFDPLAVTLVLALNNLIEARAARKEQESAEYESYLNSISKEYDTEIPIIVEEKPVSVVVVPPEPTPVAEAVVAVEPAAVIESMPAPVEEPEALREAQQACVEISENPAAPVLAPSTEFMPALDPVSNVPVSLAELSPEAKRQLELAAIKRTGVSNEIKTTWRQVVK
jgi:cell division protein FtsL